MGRQRHVQGNHLGETLRPAYGVLGKFSVFREETSNKKLHGRSHLLLALCYQSFLRVYTLPPLSSLSSISESEGFKCSVGINQISIILCPFWKPSMVNLSLYYLAITVISILFTNRFQNYVEISLLSNNGSEGY